MYGGERGEERTACCYGVLMPPAGPLTSSAELRSRCCCCRCSFFSSSLSLSLLHRYSRAGRFVFVFLTAAVVETFWVNNRTAEGFREFDKLFCIGLATGRSCLESKQVLGVLLDLNIQLSRSPNINSF